MLELLFFKVNKTAIYFGANKEINKHPFCFTQLLECILILFLDIHQISVRVSFAPNGFSARMWLPLAERRAKKPEQNLQGNTSFPHLTLAKKKIILGEFFSP